MINNLTTLLTNFVGREREAAHIKKLLTDAHLLTLTGPRGCGKTRLAVEVAATLRDAYPDGIHWIELAPLCEGELVPQTVVTTLGVRDSSGLALDQVLADFLAAKRLLLVLDNCEHVIDACAALADTLLRACPNLQCLATSREPLGIPGEATFLVPSLALPDADLLPVSGGRPAPTDADLIAKLDQVESISLFLDRARNA